MSARDFIEVASLLALAVLAVAIPDVASLLLQVSEVKQVGGTGLVDVLRSVFVIERIRLLGTANRENDNVVRSVELIVRVATPDAAGTYNVSVVVVSETTTARGSAVVYVGTTPTTVTVAVSPTVTQTGLTKVDVYATKVG